MILRKLTITNFRGINGAVTVSLDDFNCIVGQNDAGKSTILKALDAALNDTALSIADYNVQATNNEIAIELAFDCRNQECLLGEEILTTIEDEELTNDEGLLIWRKVWTVSPTNVSKAKVSIVRKKYEGTHDFVTKTETQLMTQCKTNGIDTGKGNGADFNNVEKRQKLRAYNAANTIPFTYEIEDIPGTGTSKAKSIGDAIKANLPTFQYFKADTSLSETDTTIQKYFKDMAFGIIRDEVDTDDLEETIRTQLGTVLEKITDKINAVVKSTEKVAPKIDFDWSKLISTSFVSASMGGDIPLSSRGDGFRRITMMSYFEYLAETRRGESERPIIFGFEEPETFLHPSAQENLYEKLHSLAENGYQVVVSTHSPVIVGNTAHDRIIHISKPQNVYTVNQTTIDLKALADDLGIKADNIFTPLFSASRVLFLVEGIDDANAMRHIAQQYKDNGQITHTFEELGVVIIPLGGCDSIQHWVNLNIFTRLNKPFFIFLDSDKEDITATSKNETTLTVLGFSPTRDFLISKKRLLENYIPPSALMRLVPGATVMYGDFDHAKNFCKDYPDDRIRAGLGGKKVAEKHFGSTTYDELRMTWFDGTEDEFLAIYNAIRAKI